ncbi:hypothetical protein ACJX0J_034471 [Zea mays]
MNAGFTEGHELIEFMVVFVGMIQHFALQNSLIGEGREMGGGGGGGAATNHNLCYWLSGKEDYNQYVDLEINLYWNHNALLFAWMITSSSEQSPQILIICTDIAHHKMCYLCSQIQSFDI